jgi:Tfp pilus assembly protein PilF
MDEAGEDSEIDINLEAKLAPLLAQAAQRLLQQNQAQVAQQQSQQIAKDPIVQMQQQELQIKMEEQKRKAARDVADIALEKDKLQLERDRVAASTAMDTLKSKAKMDETKLKMGAEFVKKIADQNHDKEYQKRDNALEILKYENPQTKGER